MRLAIFRGLRLYLIMPGVLLILSASTALAGPVISLENLVLNSDGTGSIDVALRIDSGTYDIAGYSVGLLVDDSTGDFRFTAIDALSPYLFGTNSFGVDASTLPATSALAFDTYFDSTGATDGVSLGDGDSRGLLHVNFSGAGFGNITVRIDPDPIHTNLTYSSGDPITGLTTGGPVIVSVAAVPEPSSLVLAFGGAGGWMLASLLKARRRSAKARATWG